MRKLLIAGVPCLVLGLSDAASAAGGRTADGSGGGAGSDGTLVPSGGRGARDAEGPAGTPSAGGTAGAATVGTATVGGITISGTTVGISGTRGGPRPVVGGQPANLLNGATGGITSRRAACPPGDLDAAKCLRRR